jgi:hypothetical protein
MFAAYEGIMTFEDVYEVEIDQEDGTFTVLRNSGNIQTYSVDAEPDFYLNILKYFEGNIYETRSSEYNIPDYY